MIYNYLKIALRSFRKNLTHSLINVFGLTLAITCTLAISLIVRDELSFDNYHTNKNNIYRLITEEVVGNDGFGPGVPLPLPLALKTDFPEFEKIVLLSHFRQGKISVTQQNSQPKVFIEDQGLVFMEDGFFQIFDWQWLHGDKITALKITNSVVLSKSYAEKFFGNDDVIGRELTLNDSKNLVVTGVVADRPFNSDFPFDVMISFSTIINDRDMTNWHSVASDNQCFVLLADQVSPALVESRLPAFALKYLKEDGEKINYSLQPLLDMHFSTEVSNMNYRSISKPMILAIALIALFLLLIGCINFINLETARAMRRSKEVGIRKTLGSNRKALIIQFLGETAIIVLISMLISLGLTEILLIELREFSGLPLAFHPFSNPFLLSYIIGLTLIITLGAGFYPALVLSSYRASEVLKGASGSGRRGRFSLRHILVSFQFVVSQIFIVCTLITLQQVYYIQEADMGFSRDFIVDLSLPDKSPTKQEFIRGELDKITGIENYSLCSFPPFSGSVWGTNINLMSTADFEDQQVQYKMVDDNYLNTYGIRIIAGTGFSRSDTANQFIVNETLVQQLGFDNPEDAIGEFIKMQRWELPIVGVVEDFHTTSFTDKISPVVLVNNQLNNFTVGIKIQAGHSKDVLARLAVVWKESFPEYQFEPQFLDEAIMDYYDGEQKMTKLLSGFSIIAIIIGSLGLYGLISFMVLHKAKEVGIRKTLGASSFSIVKLFSIEFLVLLLAGFIVSSPIAYYLMDGWLQQYVYKIEIGIGAFITGLIGSAIIALGTVGYQSLKVAIANPVKALKDE